MNDSATHAMLPTPDHDEAERQAWVGTFRRHLASRIAPGIGGEFAHRVLPRFRAVHQREPADRHEVRRAMLQSSYYQFWSALQRRSQELMWDTLADTVEREQAALAARASDLAAKAPGSLKLDPASKVPAYHTAVDIHLQPGGYHGERGEGDVAAGVLYDAALPIYLAGALGPRNDLLGRILAGFCARRVDGFAPRRILDLGCAIGNSTLPWCDAYPDAEVHAIDVGAPVLRYAHARASALGARVHFSQQNAERTNFPDAHFDLVVSHIMLHETSRAALPRILSECHRLLGPGGLMLHLEIPRGDTPFEQFMLDWETYNNNECFAGHITDADLPAMAVEAGFAPDQCAVEHAGMEMSASQRSYGGEAFTFPVLVARKAYADAQRQRA